MNLFLLLLSSFLLGLVCYTFFQRMTADRKKTFLFLLSYRFVFFGIQSALFYTVYQNQLDAVFYHTALVELFHDFNVHPSDIISFIQGDYSDLHVTAWLQTYLSEEIRVAFFLKVLSPFFLLSANNYYVLGAWLTLFGTLCFMPFLSLFKNKDSFILWVMVLCVPSFSIWTVGVLKEAFVLPVLFLLYYLLQTIIESNGKSIIAIILFIFFMVLAWYIKYYLVAIFVLGISIYLINSKISYGFNTIFALLVISTGIVFLGYMHPALQWNVLPEVIYISYNLTCTKFVDAYACISFELDMTWTSIILNYPKAIVYAFFSPFPWQIHNLTSLLAALENYVCVFLLIYMLYRWLTKKITVSNTELFCLFIILLLGGLLIMASPNIGSFSRYRIFYLPVYTYIILIHSGIRYKAVFLRFKNWIEK